MSIRLLAVSAALAFAAMGAQAASCEAQATERKLAGAAKNSFVQKCEREGRGTAAASCEARATERKLAGAARNSFVQKCERDAKAAPAAAAPKAP